MQILDDFPDPFFFLAGEFAWYMIFHFFNGSFAQHSHNRGEWPGGLRHCNLRINRDLPVR